MVIRKATHHPVETAPVVSLALLMQVVKATSNNPATIRMIQFITMMF